MLICGCMRQGRLTHLPKGFPGNHAHTHREVQAPSRNHRDDEAGGGAGVHRVRHARRFAPEQQNVVGAEGEAGVGFGRTGRQQQQAAIASLSPRIEGGEIDMPGERGEFKVIHAGAAQVPVRQVETGRLDDVHGQTKTGGGAQDRPGVARYVRLIERYAKPVFQWSHPISSNHMADGGGWSFAANAAIERACQLEPWRRTDDSLVHPAFFAPSGRAYRLNAEPVRSFKTKIRSI